MDVSRMKFGPRFFEEMASPAERAFDAMVELEKGAIANPDEGRQVGHYWLRNPSLAPTKEIAQQIEQAIAKIASFCADVHSGKVKPPRADRFTDVLLVGIGGSALGPQLADGALGNASDKMRLHFLDNTDPDGIARVIAHLGTEGLKRTLVLVVSKSGGTKETRNGMLETQAAFRKAGLSFADQAVAVTGEGSALGKVATDQKWIEQFPMWSWVGGRTSQTSAVGLLPAALQGIDIREFLTGARDCDEITRIRDVRKNPAMLLALMWMYAHSAGVAKDMVVLPYKDRLGLLTRYLQQLVMESLGKGRDLAGNVVQQGIAVYGNKGSTDQHAYVQQLREGLHNFFVTFLDVSRDADEPAIEVEEGGITSGDYLLGFLLGTRRALYDNDRESITLTIDAMSPRSLGVLIALYERAVGFYAAMVGINAYHQPGVEAGKKAANAVIVLQKRVVQHLRESGKAWTVDEIASALGVSEEAETIFKILEHLAANPDRGVKKHPGDQPFDGRYEVVG
jgi:glucose-6-phosphate isomerase